MKVLVDVVNSYNHLTYTVFFLMIWMRPICWKVLREKLFSWRKEKKFPLKAAVWTLTREFQAAGRPYGLLWQSLSITQFLEISQGYIMCVCVCVYVYLYVCVCVSLCVCVCVFPYISYWFCLFRDLDWFNTEVPNCIRVLIYPS